MDQGLDFIPQVHEGAAVRKMEARGIVTRKGDLNRFIKSTNKLLRDTIREIKELEQWFKDIKPQLNKLKDPILGNLISEYFDYRNEVAETYGRGTYSAKKNNLKLMAKIIAYLDMQLDFLWSELQGYKAVLNTLKAAKSVREASDAVLTGYEKPADQGEAVKVKRAGFGQSYYEKYAGGAQASSGGMSNADCPFKVKVTAKDLRIRKGNGTDTAWTGKYVPPGVYTIVEVKSGKGSDAGWGRLKSGAGFVALDYAKRV